MSFRDKVSDWLRWAQVGFTELQDRINTSIDDKTWGTVVGQVVWGVGKIGTGMATGIARAWAGVARSGINVVTWEANIGEDRRELVDSKSKDESLLERWLDVLNYEEAKDNVIWDAVRWVFELPLVWGTSRLLRWASKSWLAKDLFKWARSYWDDASNVVSQTFKKNADDVATQWIRMADEIAAAASKAPQKTVSESLRSLWWRTLWGISDYTIKPIKDIATTLNQFRKWDFLTVFKNAWQYLTNPMTRVWLDSKYQISNQLVTGEWWLISGGFISHQKRQSESRLWYSAEDALFAWSTQWDQWLVNYYDRHSVAEDKRMYTLDWLENEIEKINKTRYNDTVLRYSDVVSLWAQRLYGSTTEPQSVITKVADWLNLSPQWNQKEFSDENDPLQTYLNKGFLSTETLDIINDNTALQFRRERISWVVYDSSKAWVFDVMTNYGIENIEADSELREKVMKHIKVMEKVTQSALASIKDADSDMEYWDAMKAAYKTSLTDEERKTLDENIYKDSIEYRRDIRKENSGAFDRMLLTTWAFFWDSFKAATRNVALLWDTKRANMWLTQIAERKVFGSYYEDVLSNFQSSMWENWDVLIQLAASQFVSWYANRSLWWLFNRNVLSKYTQLNNSKSFMALRWFGWELVENTTELFLMDAVQESYSKSDTVDPTIYLALSASMFWAWGRDRTSTERIIDYLSNPNNTAKIMQDFMGMDNTWQDSRTRNMNNEFYKNFFWDVVDTAAKIMNTDNWVATFRNVYATSEAWKVMQRLHEIMMNKVVVDIEANWDNMQNKKDAKDWNVNIFASKQDQSNYINGKDFRFNQWYIESVRTNFQNESQAAEAIIARVTKIASDRTINTAESFLNAIKPRVDRDSKAISRWNIEWSNEWLIYWWRLDVDFFNNPEWEMMVDSFNLRNNSEVFDKKRNKFKKWIAKRLDDGTSLLTKAIQNWAGDDQKKLSYGRSLMKILFETRWTLNEEWSLTKAWEYLFWQMDIMPLFDFDDRKEAINRLKQNIISKVWEWIKREIAEDKKLSSKFVKRRILDNVDPIGLKDKKMTIWEDIYTFVFNNKSDKNNFINYTLVKEGEIIKQHTVVNNNWTEYTYNYVEWSTEQRRLVFQKVWEQWYLNEAIHFKYLTPSEKLLAAEQWNIFTIINDKKSEYEGQVIQNLIYGKTIDIDWKEVIFDWNFYTQSRFDDNKQAAMKYYEWFMKDNSEAEAARMYYMEQVAEAAGLNNQQKKIAETNWSLDQSNMSLWLAMQWSTDDLNRYKNKKEELIKANTNNWTERKKDMPEDRVETIEENGRYINDEEIGEGVNVSDVMKEYDYKYPDGILETWAVVSKILWIETDHNDVDQRAGAHEFNLNVQSIFTPQRNKEVKWFVFDKISTYWEFIDKLEEKTPSRLNNAGRIFWNKLKTKVVNDYTINRNKDYYMWLIAQLNKLSESISEWDRVLWDLEHIHSLKEADIIELYQASNIEWRKAMIDKLRELNWSPAHFYGLQLINQSTEISQLLQNEFEEDIKRSRESIDSLVYSPYYVNSVLKLETPKDWPTKPYGVILNDDRPWVDNLYNKKYIWRIKILNWEDAWQTEQFQIINETQLKELYPWIDVNNDGMLYVEDEEYASKITETKMLNYLWAFNWLHVSERNVEAIDNQSVVEMLNPDFYNQLLYVVEKEFEIDQWTLNRNLDKNKINIDIRWLIVAQSNEHFNSSIIQLYQNQNPEFEWFDTIWIVNRVRSAQKLIENINVKNIWKSETIRLVREFNQYVNSYWKNDADEIYDNRFGKLEDMNNKLIEINDKIINMFMTQDEKWFEDVDYDIDEYIQNNSEEENNLYVKEYIEIKNKIKKQQKNIGFESVEWKVEEKLNFENTYNLLKDIWYDFSIHIDENTTSIETSSYEQLVEWLEWVNQTATIMWTANDKKVEDLFRSSIVRWANTEVFVNPNESYEWNYFNKEWLNIIANAKTEYFSLQDVVEWNRKKVKVASKEVIDNTILLLQQADDKAWLIDIIFPWSSEHTKAAIISNPSLMRAIVTSQWVNNMYMPYVMDVNFQNEKRVYENTVVENTIANAITNYPNQEWKIKEELAKWFDQKNWLIAVSAIAWSGKTFSLTKLINEKKLWSRKVHLAGKVHQVANSFAAQVQINVEDQQKKENISSRTVDSLFEQSQSLSWDTYRVKYDSIKNMPILRKQERLKKEWIDLWDIIVIDEAQKLSSTELNAIKELSDRYSIILLWDYHQTWGENQANNIHFKKVATEILEKPRRGSDDINNINIINSNLQNLIAASNNSIALPRNSDSVLAVDNIKTLPEWTLFIVGSNKRRIEINKIMADKFNKSKKKWFPLYYTLYNKNNNIINQRITNELNGYKVVGDKQKINVDGVYKWYTMELSKKWARNINIKVLIDSQTTWKNEDLKYDYVLTYWYAITVDKAAGLTTDNVYVDPSTTWRWVVYWYDAITRASKKIFYDKADENILFYGEGKPEFKYKSINVYWEQPESSTSTKILSNLAPRKFTWEGREYGSIEHAYQSNKSGTFDEVTYNKYVKAGGYGKKIRGKGTVAEMKAADSLDLMQRLVVESFIQNPDSEAAKKLLQYENFTHNTKQYVDQAFLNWLKLAQYALYKNKKTGYNQDTKLKVAVFEKVGINDLYQRITGKNPNLEGVSSMDLANLYEMAKDSNSELAKNYVNVYNRFLRKVDYNALTPRVEWINKFIIDLGKDELNTINTVKDLPTLVKEKSKLLWYHKKLKKIEKTKNKITKKEYKDSIKDIEKNIKEVIDSIYIDQDKRRKSWTEWINKSLYEKSLDDKLNRIIKEKFFKEFMSFDRDMQIADIDEIIIDTIDIYDTGRRDEFIMWYLRHYANQTKDYINSSATLSQDTIIMDDVFNNIPELVDEIKDAINNDVTDEETISIINKYFKDDFFEKNGIAPIKTISEDKLEIFMEAIFNSCD